MNESRITELKILKQMDEHKDAKGSYVDMSHTTGLIPYSKTLIEVKAKVKNPMDNLISHTNWVKLSVVNAKAFNYDIKLEHQKNGGKKYDLTLIAVGRSIMVHQTIQS